MEVEGMVKTFTNDRIDARKLLSLVERYGVTSETIETIV
nr:MAG TPA: hypothetical protein [Caudoviricetes sp.]